MNGSRNIIFAVLITVQIGNHPTECGIAADLNTAGNLFCHFIQIGRAVLRQFSRPFLQLGFVQLKTVTDLLKQPQSISVQRKQFPCLQAVVFLFIR